MTGGWWNWLHSPMGPATSKLYVGDLPPNIDSLTITLVGTDIELGELMIGSIVTLGSLFHKGTIGRVKKLWTK